MPHQREAANLSDLTDLWRALMMVRDAGWSGMMTCTSTFRSSNAFANTSHTNTLSSFELFVDLC